MKKILLTTSLLVASMSAAFAQVPDASQWKAGQEITDQLNWSNLSFENPTKDPWQFTTSKGSTTETGGLFECYDGADEDLWQYVQLPAGMYRLECQGYYRCGNSWDDDPNSYGDPDRWQDNAVLYASNGTYDVTSQEFTAGRTFKKPLMPRLFLNQPTQLYEDPVKEGWDMSDGNYGDKGWGPCSVPGSLVWFQNGLYAPYDDGVVKYNTVTFFLTEDGYARVGIRKTEPRSADSFMATNFKMYYEGTVDPETAELMALQDEVAEVYAQIADLESMLENTYSGGLLYTLVSDARMEFDENYPSIEDLTTKEECEAAMAALKNIYDKATAAAAVVGKLESLVKVMDLLYNTTDYAGKAEFGAALQEAKNCIDVNYEIQEDDTFDSFQTAYDNLCAARVAYIMTQEPVNGAYNFSSAINTPFFCDNQYTPQWNEEAQAYQFPTIEGVDESLQPENTWATVQETGYGDLKNQHSDWIPICEEFAISEKPTENQWVIRSTTWHGGGSIGITMQHSYPAIGGWTAEPTGNPELLYQTITGLPNGYYSLSALMCNAGAEISPLQYAYIEAGDAKEIAPLTKKGNPWWGGNREAWRSGVWEKLTTNMVYVSDGQVTIGTSSDAFYASTGFQLYYYGEHPDFSALLGSSIEAAKKNVETLTWAGDVKAANALLAKIPEKIDSQEAYQAALEILAEVNNYVTTATNVINNWKALDNFSALNDKQPEGSVEYTIVETALMHTLSLGEGEDDTYLDAIASDNDYAAYVDYLDYRSGMGELIENEGVAKLIAEQNNYLTENYATASELNDFKAQLAAPYNKALLASLGIDKATPENPIDITSLIINPNFDEGQKGWNGEITYTSDQTTFTEELGVAERWNCNFNVSQTIYSLPAGTYRVEVQALYRDAGDASAAYNNWWYTAGADWEFWENPNAKLYANNNDSTIVSIASELFQDKSMVAFRDKWVVTEEADEHGDDVWVQHWKAQDSIAAEPYQPYVEVAADGWFWDTEVEDVEEFYYYPASLMGVSHRFAKNPESYHNVVSTNVREGGSLTFGIKKDVLVSGDWVAFDNFKLYYCGKATVDLGDITALIDEYLTEGSTVQLNDITDLIDQYLAQ